ncbi:hypothetical protein D3C84_619220 [compost metagenome]
MEDLAIKPGVAVEDLTDEKLTSRVIEFSSERFSNDRLSSRLSDLCGLVRTAWDRLGSLLQIGPFLGGVWFTITESLTNAIFSWWIVGIGLLFWIFGVLFALACRLLTDRYPGQAKKGQKGYDRIP